MTLVTLDVANKPLGRAASEAAILLRGKNRPDFIPNKLPEIKIKIINLDKIKFSGKKKTQKKYKRFSGYPGGLKEISFKNLFEKNPKDFFKRAVMGMLPKNKSRSKVIKNLIIEK